MEDQNTNNPQAAAYFPTYNEGAAFSLATGRKYGVLSLANNQLSMKLTNGQEEFSVPPEAIKSINFYNPASAATNTGVVFAFRLRLTNKQTYEMHLLPSPDQLESTTPLTPLLIAQGFENKGLYQSGAINTDFPPVLKQWIKDNKIASNGWNVWVLVFIFLVIAGFGVWKATSK